MPGTPSSMTTRSTGRTQPASSTEPATAHAQPRRPRRRRHPADRVRPALKVLLVVAAALGACWSEMLLRLPLWLKIRLLHYSSGSGPSVLRTWRTRLEHGLSSDL